MRKIISAAILLALLSCFPTAQADRVTESETGAVVICDTAKPGTEVSFMIVSGTAASWALTEESLLMIRQLTADSEGCVYAAFLGADSEESFVFVLGGQFTDGISPHVLSGQRARTIRLPEQLEVIEEEAFMGSSLSAVYIADGIASIAPAAFMNCASLRYIRIPDSVREIADNAFEGCTQLVIGCHKGSVAQKYAQNHGIACEIIDGKE